MSRANDLAAMESGLLAMRGLNNAAITANKVLTADETGVLLVDASAGAVTITLPPSGRPMDVRVQRVDNSGNRLVVQAAGDEAIKFHTRLRASGYAFFVLMGAGDYWHLRSDGAGAWLPLDRLDRAALGRPIFETSTTISPGGWGLANGALLNRVEWPWLWDYAQQSGLVIGEAERVGMEGAWTSGDGATTFRTPELRGEFLRALDEGRGIDSGRVGGGSQKGSLMMSDYPSSGQGATTLAPTASQAAADYGQDPSVHTEWPTAWGVNTASLTPFKPSTSFMLGTSRPRNLAYPARIKLI
ncbi:phage tail protein [Pseudomonas sichuanensis]|uniref:phage tail protein n=1 Tax=Pseudomonas sichuanensis TaxID=2213015 RepID=UPI002449D1C0|nr:phage tail protein [Pseudomonas sichuanensis]MDH0729623.1 phage tail protein [Pseudomonas sichuanensis]MDH1582220.1 phage tail protein [Pseudomonas sichuanensis]MDH1591325.1 phage tail protein [Pseudomonas sichuanensis]MDH1596927.1 phage tail protein [Pseudomonas sichuanensis]